MQTLSLKGAASLLRRNLVTFAFVSASLAVGAAIGMRIEELDGVLTRYLSTGLTASISLFGLPVNRSVLVAAELVLLTGLLVTFATALAGFIALRSAKARQYLEETSKRLQQEIERQKNTSDELHITHQQLTNTARQLGGILEGTTDFIAAVDTSLKYISLNEAYRQNIRELFGTDARPGMSVAEALSTYPLKRDESVSLWSRALQGEKFEAVQEFTDDLGRTFHYELTYNPIFDEQGEVTGAAQISRDVTERRNTEELLRQEMEFVSAAIDVNSSLVIVLDLEGRIIRFNQACEKLSGYSFEEVRGRVFWNMLIPTEDIAKIKSTYRNFYSTFFTADYINRWVTRNEQVKLISWQVSAIKDENGLIKYIVGTGIDITEKREFETARNRMLKILENSPDLVGIYDFQGRMTYLNHAGRRMLGIDPDTDVSLIRINAFQPDWVTEKLQAEAIPTAVKDGAWLGTTAIIPADKEETATSQLILAHQNQKGQVEYFSTVIRDISSQKELEENLAAARDEALEAIRNKSDFLANMSHEIRTPMSGIIGISELLLDTPLNREQTDYAETIQRCGEALLTIINDILDFSKLEAGKLQLENTPFDLGELVDSVVELFAQAIYKKGLELSVLVNHDVPSGLKGDAGRLRQVLTNLVSNAVKFTDSGEIVVRVSSEVGDGAARIRFSVTDTGIGVEPEKQEALFQPYSQARPEGCKDYGGTGLGLAICKQIVELLEGEIGLDSNCGTGSTFWFEVPLEVQSESGSDHSADLRGKRLLVIDDNDTNRRVVLHQAKIWGMVVDEAGSGEAGIALMRAAARNRERFDAVAIDLNMPGISGLETAAAIKDDPVLRNTGVLLMTSAAHRSRITNEQKRLVDYLVSKPVRLTELMSALSVLFGAGKHAEEEESPPDAEYRAMVKELGAPGKVPRERKRILIAEDNLVNRKVLSSQIRRLGYDVDIVENGEEALKAI